MLPLRPRLRLIGRPLQSPHQRLLQQLQQPRQPQRRRQPQQALRQRKQLQL